MTEARATLTAAGEATPWKHYRSTLAVQVTGAATNVVLVVERSTLDPQKGSPDAVVVEQITGSAVAGIAPRGYDEPASAWWRVRAVTLAGGPVKAVVSGVWGG